MRSCFVGLIFIFCNTPLEAEHCGAQGVWVQVLGSGGPELDNRRASSGYVIWQDGKARVLVDMGAGSLLHFEQSGAALNDLEVVLLSHFHVDHVNDLPALIMASFFTYRQRDLPLYGPTGNDLMPSAKSFVQSLFGASGAYRYLGSYLDGSDSYRLIANNVESKGKALQVVIANTSLRIVAVPVHHGPIPALAWRVELGNRSLVFSGDMNNENNTLAELSKAADLLVAHHAIPENAGGVARNLHMPPSVIGKIAAKPNVKQLVLSHRMNRTIGKEQASTRLIRQNYRGVLHFADDLQCFRP